MKKLIKEPLVHFILLGSLIYGASYFTVDNDKNSQEIVVTEGKLEQLAMLFRKTWQRPASPEEFQNVVNEYVLEQAAYIEGVKLGLNTNDIVITRRVRQKLDFIAEESGPKVEVTDKVLTLYLKENAEKFNTENRYTFKQVFFESGQQNNETINGWLTKLNSNAALDISQLGKPSFFAPLYTQKSTSEIEREFGINFAARFINMPVREWQGIIHSAYGAHLVYVEAKQVGRLPSLAEVRSKVIREWEHEQRQATIKNFYQELLTRYPVTVMWPNDSTKVSSLPSDKSEG